MRAQDAITIADTGCDGVLFRAESLRRLLAIELADVGAVIDDGAGRVVVTLRSNDCAATRGTLHISIDRDARQQTRTIELDGSEPDSRERVAALAIAELLIASRSPAETAIEPASVAAPMPSHVAIEPDSALAPAPSGIASNEAWSAQVTAAIEGDLFAAVSTGMGAVRAGVRLVAPRHTPWVLEASARGATGIGALGVVETRAHWLGVEVGALALARGDGFDVGGGVDAQLGAAWVVGSDVASGGALTFVDPSLLISLRGAFIGWISPRVGLSVDLRAGWVIVGVELRSMGRTLAGIAGPRLALELGIVIGLE